MIFKKGGRNFQNITFYFDDKEIKIVNEYTYLGISFKRVGLFCEAAEQMSKKSSIASASALATIKKSGINQFGTVFKLFNLLVQSVSLYSCEVWSVSHLDSLIKVQNSFFKNLLHLPKCMPNYAVRYELQLATI